MKLEAFHPYVMPEVVGCPDLLIDMHLVSAAADFCRETLSWTEAQDPIVLVDGVASYDLDTPSQAYVVAIRDVFCNGNRLFAYQGVAGPLSTSSTPTMYNSSSDFGVITVYPTPSAPTASLSVRSAFAPALGSTSLPDYLAQRFMMAIAAGTKSRLMAMPGVTWSNPSLSAYYQQQFSTGIYQSRSEEVHERTPGRLVVKPNRFDL